MIFLLTLRTLNQKCCFPGHGCAELYLGGLSQIKETVAGKTYCKPWFLSGVNLRLLVLNQMQYIAFIFILIFAP